MPATKKIIVLEDDRASSSLLRSLLERRGYHVTESREGRMAVELAIKEKPDLLIADVMLPDMHGSEAVKKIRESRAAEGTKVMFMTALLGKKTPPGEETVLTVDGEEYPAMSKPYRPDKLMGLVERLIGGPN